MTRTLGPEATVLAVIGAAAVLATGVLLHRQMLAIWLIAGLVALGIRTAGVVGDLLNAHLSR